MLDPWRTGSMVEVMMRSSDDAEGGGGQSRETRGRSGGRQGEGPHRHPAGEFDLEGVGSPVGLAPSSAIRAASA